MPRPILHLPSLTGRSVLAVVTLVALPVIGWPQPVGAHTGRGPTNDRVRIVAVEPAVEGLHVVLRPGRVIEVVNDTDAEVIVLGYDGEPFLRLRDGVVEENRRSPSTYLNRSYDGEQPPPDADATAAPEWRRREGTTARWHDHHLHSGGSSARGLADWQIDLEVDGRPVAVRGELRVLDPPMAWPWWLVGAAAFVASSIVARTIDHRRALVAVLALAGMSGVVIAIGAGAPLMWTAALASLAMSLAIARRVSAIWAGVLGAGTALVAATELSDLDYHDLAMSVPGPLYRLAVPLTVGLGAAAALTVLDVTRRGGWSPPAEPARDQAPLSS